GLTPGELRALSTSDVRLPRAGSGTPCRLQVPASASTPARETPVAPWATRLLRRWLEQREALAIPGPMLLPSTRSSGKPWGKVAQYNATAAVLAEAGLADVTGGSFRLRHTFALRQLRRGTAEHEVARWLGVSDPAVMARYRGVLAAPR
ncbi:MAG TPA: site-specific integrase, partial [Burkholderiaceae bacterium]